MILASPMLYYEATRRVQMRVAPEIVLTDDERAELMRLIRSQRISVRLSHRARMVLLAAEGMQNKDIAEQLGVGRVQVARWRERYEESRLAGIVTFRHNGAGHFRRNGAT